MVRMVLIHMVVCHPAYSIGITFFEIDLSFQKGELCYAKSEAINPLKYGLCKKSLRKDEPLTS